jgi:hypothetical protein
MPLVELPGFAEKVRRQTWRGNVLPTPYLGRVLCSRCQSAEMIPLAPVVSEALFFFGGYGEAVRTTAAVCPACHRVVEVRRESVAPLRRVRLDVAS